MACGDASPQAMPVASPAAVSVPAQTGSGSTALDVSRRTAIVTAAARVAPATVSVNVTRRERRRAQDWGFFFLPREYEQLVQNVGSGFIVSHDGLVITNQHVTSGAQEIIVTTRDGTDYPARLLGEDPLTDIAVLKIDGDALPVAPLGSSTDLMIGEWVVAIGNPYNYLLGNSEPTVTAGVVSGVGRNLLPSTNATGVYVGMIQTDAAINPGNSGGPLANALGNVVGVNASIFTESGGSVGIGFAIPIERALRVARELQSHGEVRRSWIGLDVAGAERLRDWKRAGGLEVTSVAEGGPAYRGGIRSGDILVSAHGMSLRTFLDWEAVKLEVSPGDNLEITYHRDGRERRATVGVANLPTSQAERISVLGAMELITLTPAVRQERGVRVDRGALIATIAEAAQRSTFLRPGDVIYQINRVPIESAEDVRRVLQAAAGGPPIRVYFERGRAQGATDFRVGR